MADSPEPDDAGDTHEVPLELQEAHEAIEYAAAVEAGQNPPHDD